VSIDATEKGFCGAVRNTRNVTPGDVVWRKVLIGYLFCEIEI